MKFFISILISIALLFPLSANADGLKEVIFEQAAKVGVPPQLLSAICFVESSHRPRVVNTSDPSYGLCQLKLGTAKWMGYQGGSSGLLSPDINAYYAAKYLRYQLKRYKGNFLKAVSAYNGGRFMKNYGYVHKVMRALVEGR